VKQIAFVVVSILHEIIHSLMETNSGNKQFFHDASVEGGEGKLTDSTFKKTRVNVLLLHDVIQFPDNRQSQNFGRAIRVQVYFTIEYCRYYGHKNTDDNIDCYRYVFSVICSSV
jgi:hypothetical protein